MPETASPERPSHLKRLLIVDDDPMVLRVQERILVAAGYQVVIASQVEAALAALAAGRFDAVVSDVHMPGRTGVDLLRAIRLTDLDLSVILVTGMASVATAAEAVATGAFRYLIKPVDVVKLKEAVALAVSATAVARLKRELLAGDNTLGDRAALEAQFQLGLEQLWMAYQPIIRWSTKSVIAYEALMRSKAPGMGNPMTMLDAAERLGRLDELGRTVRARAGQPWLESPPAARLFVNLHSADLVDETLYDPTSTLGRLSSHVVLEITERASLEKVVAARERISRLRALGFHIALDDIGTGYSGLSSFALIEPETVKLDMSLVRGIESSPLQQKLVRASMTMCEGLEVVAEGVETIAERDFLLTLGCDVFQGYLFGKPDAALRSPFGQTTSTQ